MKYNLKQEDTKLIVNGEGELDVRTSPEFEQALLPALGGVKELVIDLEGLEYISSAGLRVLLSLHKSMLHKGEMILLNVNQDLMGIFEVTGFVEILNIQ